MEALIDEFRYEVCAKCIYRGVGLCAGVGEEHEWLGMPNRLPG